jgi:hypothetical protein
MSHIDGEKLPLTGEVRDPKSTVQFEPTGPRLESCWYINARDMCLRLGAQTYAIGREATLRGYQFDLAADALLMKVGETALIDGPIQLVEFQLVNPYSPILLVFLEGGVLRDAAVIPFPSLCPNGTHESELWAAIGQDLWALTAELLGRHLSVSAAGTNRAITEIAVDTRRAFGNEFVLSPEFRAWISLMFEIRVLGTAELEQDPQIGHTRGGELPVAGALEQTGLSHHAVRNMPRRLICPPNGLPSLHLVTASEAETGALAGGHFVLVDVRERTAFRWLVQVPSPMRNRQWVETTGGEYGYPFLDSGHSGGSFVTPSSGPVALIRLEAEPPHLSQMLMPLAPDSDSSVIAAARAERFSTVHLAFTCSDVSPQVFAGFLASLSLQSDIRLGHAVVVTSESGLIDSLNAALATLYPGPFEVMVCDLHADSNQRRQMAMRALRARATAGAVLCVNEGVILADARTLDTLTRLLALPSVTSAGCPLITSPQGTNGTVVGRAFAGAPLLCASHPGVATVEPLDLAALFPRQTFMVAAQSDACFMTVLSEMPLDDEVPEEQHHVFTTRIAIELPLAEYEEGPPVPALWPPASRNRAPSLCLTRLPS